MVEKGSKERNCSDINDLNEIFKENYRDAKDTK
jgi:hypothetical protein